MKHIKYIVLLLIALFLLGCGGSTYNHPSKSELHALIVPVQNEEHKFSIFNDSTIFIYKINNKDVSDMWEGRNTIKRVVPGKITLYIEEDQATSEFLFAANLSFHARKGEKYIINSKLTKENNKIVNIEFTIVNKGKVIARSQSEKIRKGKSIYIPIII